MTTLSPLPLTAPLLVRDGRDVLAIGFDDVVKYHGRATMGALAVAYRVMHVAFAALSPGAPVERRAVSVLTAFPVDGAADAFEMVTRCRSDGRYQVDTKIDAACARLAPAGRLFFQFSTPDNAVAFGVPEELVAEEHVDMFHANHLVRKYTQTGLEGAHGVRLEEIKLTFANKVFTLPDEQLFVSLPAVTQGTDVSRRTGPQLAA
jgi:hypothetical protein